MAYTKAYTEHEKKIYDFFTNGKTYENPLDDPYLGMINKNLYYELRTKHENFIHNLTLENFYSLDEEYLNKIIMVDQTGFHDLFINKNTKLVNDDKLIEILEVFKKRKQRLFEYTYYYILEYSDRVRNWVFTNLKINDHEYCIEDKENY